MKTLVLNMASFTLTRPLIRSFCGRLLEQQLRGEVAMVTYQEETVLQHKSMRWARVLPCPPPPPPPGPPGSHPLQ